MEQTRARVPVPLPRRRVRTGRGYEIRATLLPTAAATPASDRDLRREGADLRLDNVDQAGSVDRLDPEQDLTDVPGRQLLGRVRLASKQVENGDDVALARDDPVMQVEGAVGVTVVTGAERRHVVADLGDLEIEVPLAFVSRLGEVCLSGRFVVDDRLGGRHVLRH